MFGRIGKAREVRNDEAGGVEVRNGEREVRKEQKGNQGRQESRREQAEWKT